MVENVLPRQVWEALRKDPKAQLVDVRTDAEWTFVGLPDLTEIRLLTLRGRRIWKLRPASGDALHIPVEAQGADALFDAFAGLPGIDMGALLAALGADGPGDSRVVALNSVDRLLWTRKGAGIVSRSEV